MANQKHLALLKQGMKVWNQWRYEHPKIRPDFSGADLGEAFLPRYYFGGYITEGLSISSDFTNANLGKANLDNADLRSADLRGANLSEANLTETILSGANFSEANLSKSLLVNAYLNGTTLSEANLSEANLIRANFNGANLINTDLSKAVIGWTTIGNVDLRCIQGLATVNHLGPSTIGIDTILRSEGDIPETFLRGTGATDAFIDYIRTLAQMTINFYSCFISYSGKDEVLARRLCADLQDHGVRCWFALEDMKIGDKIRMRINEAIHMHEKLLLLLSEHAIGSSWVEDEVEIAFAKEREQNREVLFPVRLDETIMQAPQAWAKKLRDTRHIGNFTNWTNSQAYQAAFDRLLRDLRKADEPRNEKIKQ